MVVPMGWDITYCGAELSYHHVLGPLFGDCPDPWALPTTHMDLYGRL